NDKTARKEFPSGPSASCIEVRRINRAQTSDTLAQPGRSPWSGQQQQRFAIMLIILVLFHGQASLSITGMQFFPNCARGVVVTLPVMSLITRSVMTTRFPAARVKQRRRGVLGKPCRLARFPRDVRLSVRARVVGGSRWRGSPRTLAEESLSHGLLFPRLP